VKLSWTQNGHLKSGNASASRLRSVPHSGRAHPQNRSAAAVIGWGDVIAKGLVRYESTALVQTTSKLCERPVVLSMSQNFQVTLEARVNLKAPQPLMYLAGR